MFFSQRKRLTELAEIYCEKRWVPKTPLNIVSALSSMDALKDPNPALIECRTLKSPYPPGTRYGLIKRKKLQRERND